MKRFRKILLLLIMIPFCFSFVSCKDKSEDSGGGSGGGSGGSGGNNNVSAECFTIEYDYNLPEKYDFLLTDYVDSNNEVGTSVQPISIIDDNLAPHFLGWYNSDDELVTGEITSSTPTTISLKGKWNEEDIDKFYFTKGLTFEIVSGKAQVLSYSGSATKIVLPKLYVSETVSYPVKLIGDSVFEGSRLTSLIVNAENFEIGNSSFKNSKITSFDFSSVTKIGEGAFENTKIQTIDFASNLTSVGANAFKSCSNLETVDFAQAELAILDYAFYGCEKLSSIENANNLLYIQNYSFAECSSLQNMSFIEDNAKLTYIGENAFENCTGLKSIFVPETVINVITPFDGCENVSSVILSRTYATSSTGADRFINHIGDISSSVKTITFIGNSATTLYENYFADLTKLETFVMCDSITIVQNYTFKGCVNLKNVTLSNGISLANFSYDAFSGTKYLTERTEPLIFKGSLVYIPQNIVSEYVIPSDVTRINDSAFAYISRLEKITIPASIESIGDNAFAGCSNLGQVIFEDNDKLTKLGNACFLDCVKLETIDLTTLSVLSEIGSEAFRATSIANMVIPSTVTVIGENAFVYSEMVSFEIFGAAGKFFAEDGVLYEDISTAGDKSELKLYSYPKLKTGNFFVCPEEVSVISSSAFVNVSNLNIYFAHSEMEWESSTAFNGTLKIKILRENASFDVSKAAGVAVYTLLSSGYSYYGDTGLVVFKIFRKAYL